LGLLAKSDYRKDRLSVDIGSQFLCNSAPTESITHPCWLSAGTDRSRVPFVMARSSWIKVAVGAKIAQSFSGCSFFEIALGSHAMGKGLLLWLLGIPIPVIVLLYVFHVI